jgi:phosphatidylglycerol:prolipoprotein diacylglycerol transferase
VVHDLDPFLWQISGSFGIRWYGLAYLAGFVFAFFMLKKEPRT